MDVTLIATKGTTGIHMLGNHLTHMLPRVDASVRVFQTEPQPLIHTPSTTLNQLLSCVRTPADVYHFTAPEFCTWDVGRKPSIVTIHDLWHLTQLSSFSHNPAVKISVLAQAMQYLRYRWVRKAHHIHAISNTTKQNIIRSLHIPEKRISVIYHGVDHAIFRPTKNPRPENTVLYVGSETPRKNLHTLLEALALVKQEISDVTLIKAGQEHWHGAREKLVAHIRQLKLENNVVFTNYAPQVYQNATAFILPSLLEGFGLPLLEAMASGTPCIASNTSSLPEVGGDAVAYCDPHDVKNIAQQIISVLQNKQFQNKLARKGQKQSLQFTWERTAGEVLRLYETVRHE